ncbi:MAG: hypothetical protein KME56_12400 [Candidatus Thiodiazotropha sp. (ex Ctena orbiculata)]|nr:hypothetical protein [Candidatus Thiodiazotropha taylori]MBT2997421.1 hypothetical protein [Candidatus Thiodiazotropha taylori]MBT3001095.1 hypothetical protein [Candidatus Thiodiazotropha taylori]MBV2107501.1 hypothetical protein [Candidatus Thiodiazotropha taylori]MBV2111942.1 hypothetical protein [Candidatus Thiodiazotropha taylori]
MNIDMPSPFESMKAPSASNIAAIIFSVGLEVCMFIMFYAVYSETVGLMNETYLSELPVIGAAFSYADPDANASHIVSLLLATFSVATPLFIWAEVFRQKILDDPQEFFSHRQNQIIATIAGLVLAMVVGLEVINMYTLIARETMPSGFIPQTQESGIMVFLAENKGLAIGVSVVIVVINIILALFTTISFRSLKSTQE